MTCRKTCSYKNCKSDSANPICTETFFSFPRDEIRYKQWMMLSQTMDERPVKYLCSKHFDHKKYMSSKPRRKLLLSTAIPFPYESDSDSVDGDTTRRNDISEEHDENSEIDSNDESSLIAVVKIESQKSSDGDEEIEFLENDSWPDNVENSVQQINKTYMKIAKISDNNLQNCQYRERKRKIKDFLTSSYSDDNELCNSNHKKKIKSINERINIEEYENDYDNIDEDNSDDVDDGNPDNNYLENMSDDDLITHPDIETYFINDEEYIKLPKSLYCCEKRQLLKEISYYKEIILDFKKKLSNVKL